MNGIFQIKNGYVAVFVLFLFFVAAAESLAEEAAGQTKTITKVAALSFQAVAAKKDSGNTVASPLSKAVYLGGRIVAGGEKKVEDLFFERLKKIEGTEIISRERTDAVFRRISSESLKMPLLEILKKTGTELEADLIVVGYVFRFAERVGYDYSVEKPASVAFEISFINPQNGNVMWRGVFDKTQKSLMEDVLQIASFYKGRGKWLTAGGLAGQGMEEIFKTLPVFEHRGR